MQAKADPSDLPFLRGGHDKPLVKICGITNPADAEAAVECGADALGFNVFSGSKRKIELAAARAWINRLPAGVTRVLVGVNPSLEQALEWIADRTFHAVQLHGTTWHPFVSRLVEARKPLIAAIAVRDNHSVAELDWFSGFAFLFDGYRAGVFGGTGESFSWDILRGQRVLKPVILAGGLTPENVARAIRIVNPYAVDVASGVESRPGKKDRGKLRDFIAAAKEMKSTRSA
ncbi:MAG TPA: phosphoribosylanthranilate isomerase [Chthoniobacterales bacterium]|nr:phosphoribosylanthranilate isomerase [Chthoniobacterales bacterium]